MVENKGVAPPDTATDTGKLRVVLGDLSFTDLEPPELGFGNYTLFGDSELETFLEIGGGLEAAASLAFMQLATSAAMESKTVRDYDLQVDLTKRSKEFRDLAQMWKDRADELTSDIFELADVLIRDRHCAPEANPRPFPGACDVRFL